MYIVYCLLYQGFMTKQYSLTDQKVEADLNRNFFFVNCGFGNIADPGRVGDVGIVRGVRFVGDIRIVEKATHIGCVRIVGCVRLSMLLKYCRCHNCRRFIMSEKWGLQKCRQMSIFSVIW